MNAPRSHYRTTRWWIVALLFLATIVNYIDRQALAVLKEPICGGLGFTDAQFGYLGTAFLISYMVMYTVAGRLIDRVGIRLGVTACVGLWSVASMLTGLAQGFRSLTAFRVLLGVGEPGIFPGGIKACGEWFPKKMRALPTGIFSSGSAVGAVIAVPLLAWITQASGTWRAAFIIPGAVGLLWIPFFWKLYRPPAKHPAVTAADLAELREGGEHAASPSASGRGKKWGELLSQRKVWGLVLSRFASDPVWHFYLLWLPGYFMAERGLSLKEVGIYLWLPYLFGTLGNVAGGWFSDALIRRGWTAPRARFAMLACAGLLTPFGALVGFINSIAAAIAITCLITFMCQMWSTNTATLAADITDTTETASVMGLMGSAGSLTGAVFMTVVGLIVTKFGYAYAFVLAATLHPIAAVTLFLFLKPALAGGAAGDGRRQQSPGI
ncbi:MAG: MFS transporter [Opitutaceae bacterium]|nr:MFS transporter [Opitutaceae bacterium]